MQLLGLPVSQPNCDMPAAAQPHALCCVVVCRRLRKWYEEFQMWTLTAKPAPAPLEHNPKVSSAAAPPPPAAGRPQQPPGDAAAAAAAGGGSQPTEFAGFDQGLGPLEYVLAAAQQYFRKLPSMTSFTVHDWLSALLDSMGLDGNLAGQDPALLLLEVSHEAFIVSACQLSCWWQCVRESAQLLCLGGFATTLWCSCAHPL